MLERWDIKGNLSDYFGKRAGYSYPDGKSIRVVRNDDVLLNTARSGLFGILPEPGNIGIFLSSLLLLLAFCFFVIIISA